LDRASLRIVCRFTKAQADEKLRKFSVDFSMRQDIYAAVMEYEEKRKTAGVVLSAEAERYVEKTLLDFKRDGLQLQGEKRERLIELKKLVSEKEVMFQKNLNEDTSKMAVSRDELEGMPDDFIDGLEDAEDGKKWLTLKYPDLLPTMQKCKREATRKALDALRAGQCEEANTPLLEDTLRLRREIAEILGYKTHADYQLEVRMSKKAAAVYEMYDKLVPRLMPPAQAELAVLKELKQQEKQERGEDFDGKINSWDFQYYNTLLKERKYTIDEDKVKQYFPLGKVKAGLLVAYQTILSLKFAKVENPRDLWHADVELYEVYDGPSGDFMGFFYLDLFPRDGKYGHAAVFGLQVCLPP
jgi:thimet oligopeptidase